MRIILAFTLVVLQQQCHASQAGSGCTARLCLPGVTVPSVYEITVDSKFAFSKVALIVVRVDPWALVIEEVGRV
jgi:hypothetical protein